MKKCSLALAITILTILLPVNNSLASNNIIHFSQNDPRWKNDQLGKSAFSDLVPNYSYTMGNAGCAITSIAMVLKSKGIDVDPQRLNWWLADHHGVSSYGFVIWNTITGYDAAITKINNYTYANWDAINSELDNGGAAVVGLRVGNNAHFVVITDKIDGQYYINDPWFDESKGKHIPLQNNITHSTKIYRTVTFETIPPPQAVGLSVSSTTFNSTTLSWTKNQSQYFSCRIQTLPR